MIRAVFLVLVFACPGICTFAQPGLDHYVTQGKINSPLVRDSKNQSQANLLEAERLRAQYRKLQISLAGNYVFAPVINRDNNRSKFEANPTAVERYSGYDLAVSNGGLYSGLPNRIA